MCRLTHPCSSSLAVKRIRLRSKSLMSVLQAGSHSLLLVSSPLAPPGSSWLLALPGPSWGGSWLPLAPPGSSWLPPGFPGFPSTPLLQAYVLFRTLDRDYPDTGWKPSSSLQRSHTTKWLVSRLPTARGPRETKTTNNTHPDCVQVGACFFEQRFLR